ncbi:MAG: ABC transporter permease [Candidatus Babeliales bacterium]
MKHELKQLVQQEIAWFLAVPAFLWQLLFFCIPLLFILVLSVVDDTYQITTAHIASVINGESAHIIIRSLCLALVNASLCAIIAYPLAYHLVFNVIRWRTTLLFFLMLPFWTNLLVQVYAWFFLLDTYGMINTILLSLGMLSKPLHMLNTPFAVYLVMIFYYLPFMVMPLYASLEKCDRRLFEASADLGATPWETFIRVTLPLSLSGIRTGFFLVFVPSFGEYVIPMLMGGGKQLYVGSLISHYFLVVKDAHVGAAFTCVTGVVLLVSALIMLFLFKQKVVKGG